MSGLTLGSLFSGSGAFELAGLRNGITPVWASELEPFPIRVTTKRLPQVEHVGNITKLNGADLPPVSIVTFGSPCTDVSISGGRSGIHGKQSGLFFEAIRVIREMRRTTSDAYPRYAVFENVPGLYSSNAGLDMQTVLTELVRLADEGADVPLPEKGRWQTAGVILGDGYSLAWRTLNACLWGVPQRRRRCYAVLDLGGGRAPDILLERGSVPGDPAPGGREGKEATTSFEGSLGEAGVCSVGFEPGAVKRMGGHAWSDLCGTLRAEMGDNQAHVAYGVSGNLINRQLHNGPNGIGVSEEVGPTLTARDRHAVAYALTAGSFGSAHQDVAATLLARDWKSAQLVAVEPEYVVRRLSVRECAKLQGMPADWCDDLETPDPTEDDITFWTDVFEQHRLATKPHVKPRSRNQIVKWLRNPYTEAVGYKLFGNGVALPNACFVLAGIARAENTLT